MSKATDEARAEALDAAGAVLVEALDEAGRYAVEALFDGDALSILDRLAISLGLAHPQGAHHTAPGFASIVEAAKP